MWCTIEGFAEFRPVVDALLGEYDLTADAVTPVRFTNNAVFRLDSASKRCALRIHRPGYRTPRQIRSELTYMAAVAAGGNVEVPLPVANRSGDLVSTVYVTGERRHGSVVTWLDGEVRRPGRGAGPKTLHRIGQALGSLHKFSESFAAPNDFELPTWDVAALFEAGGLDRFATRAQQRMFDEVRHRVDVLFNRLARGPDSFGLLHHDFILLNCLHHGRRTAVIDFDDCGWGFYLQDLGGILGNLKDYSGYRSLRRPLLDGYRSARPLPSESEEDLELMIALRHCISTLWLVNRHQQSAIGEDRFQHLLTFRIEEIKASLAALT